MDVSQSEAQRAKTNVIARCVDRATTTDIDVERSRGERNRPQRRPRDDNRPDSHRSRIGCYCFDTKYQLSKLKTAIEKT
jgi:hypothetical protein